MSENKEQLEQAKQEIKLNDLPQELSESEKENVNGGFFDITKAFRPSRNRVRGT
ncbi:hypothetical protein [Paenibacillus turpanensis]|uniref:hypothetical protein n=1 Tax=Paenibacillus turpanensis TaxID=2689078 RepID=UPI00140A0084|nr:hypothetical protein [Paenibacillus turpanensis]